MNVFPGAVWRRIGPRGWARIDYVCLPGHDGDDQGLPGVGFTEFRGKMKGRKGRPWFLPAKDEAAVETYMRGHGRYPPDEHMERLHEVALREDHRRSPEYRRERVAEYASELGVEVVFP